MVSVLVFCLVLTAIIHTMNPSQFKEFIDFNKSILFLEYDGNEFIQKNIHSPLVVPVNQILNEITFANDGKFTKYNLGPRILIEPEHFTVLVFYVTDADKHLVADLLDLLYQYKIEKAVFIFDTKLIKDDWLLVKTIENYGYVVKPWSDKPEYNSDYMPTTFLNVVLDNNATVRNADGYRDVMKFFDTAFYSLNSTTLVFTPKILGVGNGVVIKHILNKANHGMVFLDEKPPEVTNSKIHSKDNSQGYSGPSSISVYNGIWTMAALSEKYPSAIYSLDIKNPHSKTFIVSKPIKIMPNAELNFINETILLESTNELDVGEEPVSIEVRGKLDIINSTITSWDTNLNRPDHNPYHPRPYIIIKEGKMDVLSSKILSLGYSLGGFNDTRFARAALGYYDTSGFVIANSTIAHNYYGFYSDHTNNFKIINNEIYGQTKYGLDPHTYSVDFLIDSNYIHDNGNQGIICSQWCENVTITNNIVEYNVEGIGLHWLTNSSLIQNNTVRYNEKYGIFIQFDSFENIVQDNIVEKNGFGIGLLQGSKNNTIRSNLVRDNLGDDYFIEPGSEPNLIIDNYN